MIFNTFNPNTDIVNGRSVRVSSGIWPNNSPAITQSLMVDDFFSLTGSIGNPSYGSSVYDIRRTMYYLNAFPTVNEFVNNDPYFTIAYGNIAGELGSGSFTSDVNSIQAFASKAIYTQYKNLLLGDTAAGTFFMNLGSSVVAANDIWVIAFSSYKMKDNVDAGMLQFSLSGSLGNFTFIDDSPYNSTVQTSYQIIVGALNNPPTSPTYEGLGLFFPASGIVVLNASKMAAKLGITSTVGVGSGNWKYNPNKSVSLDYTFNHKTLFESLKLCSNAFQAQDSEYVPSIQYYIRVQNKDFNYSNNPTYVYDGTDGIHPAGYIYNNDYISNPTTYITTIGLYNTTNELVAVAKLSRPAIKTFDNELLLKVKIDT